MGFSLWELGGPPCKQRLVGWLPQEAIDADPRNPLAKFERASVLLSEERYRDALAELHALKVRQAAGRAAGRRGDWLAGWMSHFAEFSCVVVCGAGCYGACLQGLVEGSG
jgi:hypothetical protein